MNTEKSKKKTKQQTPTEKPGNSNYYQTFEKSFGRKLNNQKTVQYSKKLPTYLYDIITSTLNSSSIPSELLSQIPVTPELLNLTKTEVDTLFNALSILVIKIDQTVLSTLDITDEQADKLINSDVPISAKTKTLNLKDSIQQINQFNE
jgi:hypothetical protein